MAIYSALEAGFRYIDTAQIYGTEGAVGEAVRLAIGAGSISREEVFIGTKLDNNIRGYEDTLWAVQMSLERLQLEYIDMFMLHWPKPRKYLLEWREKDAESWKALEECVRNGKVRSLGVCNFLEHLLEVCEIKPCVNQLELHPYYWQDSAVSYCRANEIKVQAWSPIANGKCLKDKYLSEIGKKYNKNVAQVCIRYACCKKTMPIVKAASREHQEENLALDWYLDEKDIERIDLCRNHVRVGRHPDDE